MPTSSPSRHRQGVRRSGWLGTALVRQGYVSASAWAASISVGKADFEDEVSSQACVCALSGCWTLAICLIAVGATCEEEGVARSREGEEGGDAQRGEDHKND